MLTIIHIKRLITHKKPIPLEVPLETKLTKEEIDARQACATESYYHSIKKQSCKYSRYCELYRPYHNSCNTELDPTYCGKFRFIDKNLQERSEDEFFASVGSRGRKG